MAQIEFSSIGRPSDEITQAMRQFEKETGNLVHLRVMQWEYAWPELLSYALHGNGPDISHVGSTWVSSLVKMNALRPFQPAEISARDAKNFLPSSWNSVVLSGEETVWALPWTAFTFLICYRRDMFTKAGVDVTTAFNSAASLSGALKKIAQGKMFLPLIMPTSKPNVDVLHMAAPWVWGAGGDFIGEDGRTILFTEQNSINGLKAYYELGEVIPPLARNLDSEQVMAIFRQGEAAMTICSMDEPYTILREEVARPVVRENLGVAAMPGTPWVGGDNLVIWQHAQDDPRREQAAVALAKYLVDPQVQKDCSHGEEFIAPTRLEALNELPLPGSEATREIERSFREGRSYCPIALWGRVETLLGAALNMTWFDVFEGVPLEQAIRNQLEPVAEKLRSALSH